LPERKIQPKKKEALEKIEKIMGEYEVIAAADLRGVRSTQIQEIRKTMRGKVKMLVTKNTIFKKASQQLESKKKSISEFAESISGPIALLFTDMNPYELILFLNRNKVKVPAKGGDIASGEIIITAGNTGLPPGPIISEFGDVKIPTKIESGSIWISRDTVVARRGDTISTKLASVLTRLGMKPMEAGLSIIGAYEKGTILAHEALKLDLAEYKQNFVKSFNQALVLAIEAGYLTPESTPPIIGKAWRQAQALAVKSEYVTPETFKQIMSNAQAEMLALSNAVSAIKKEAAPQPVAG
jgi:large subunit ribosomal protein L10